MISNSIKCLLICVLYIVCINAKYPQCANGTIWTPEPGTTWYWFLGEGVTTALVDSNPAQVYDFDLFYTPTSVIEYIHRLNRTMICYIDTAYEPNRPDSSQFTKEVIGKDMKGWPGQKWVDVRSDNVKEVMRNRLVLAWNKGCDAVEWDDVDSYKNNPGFDIAPSDQANFNVFLARITHDYNMSVGLKNDLDQIPMLVDYFDWALNEQCNQYKECDRLQPFVDDRKAVFGAEYEGSASSGCGGLNNRGFSWLYTNIDVNTPGTPCCRYKEPPCASVAYSCVQAPTVYPIFSAATSSLHLSTIHLTLYLLLVGLLCIC